MALVSWRATFLDVASPSSTRSSLRMRATPPTAAPTTHSPFWPPPFPEISPISSSLPAPESLRRFAFPPSLCQLVRPILLGIKMQSLFGKSTFCFLPFLWCCVVT